MGGAEDERSATRTLSMNDSMNLLYTAALPAIYHRGACTSGSLDVNDADQLLPQEVRVKNYVSNLRNASLYGDADPV